MQQKYAPIDIHALRNALRDISFDLFLKVSETHYAHVFSKTTGLDYHRLEKYIERGVSQLYVREEELEAFVLSSRFRSTSFFETPSLPQEKRMAALLNMTEQNLAQIFARFGVDESTANSSRKLIKGYVSLMTDDPQSLSVILKLISYGDYLYYHAVAVSVFSLLLARALGQFDMRTLEIIGMGGFLHDIGRTKIPAEINQASGELSEEQWETMKTHPKIGLEMLEATPGIPDEVRYIVYQHHEQPGGGGYPNALRGPVIYPPARIVAVCDGFSALISERPWRKAYSVGQAIRIMESEQGKYDRNLLKTLQAVLTPRPAQKDAA